MIPGHSAEVSSKRSNCKIDIFAFKVYPFDTDCHGESNDGLGFTIHGLYLFAKHQVKNVSLIVIVFYQKFGKC